MRGRHAADRRVTVGRVVLAVLAVVIVLALELIAFAMLTALVLWCALHFVIQ